ncbi:MAG TPA: RtcB family protein [Planctomycetota bacterium]|nr:RtcB family protein [Planctomycetota bacterium]
MKPESRHVVVETGAAPVKAWIRGVPVEPAALEQLKNVARLPFVHRWVAAMPDVHVGIGATVGSVVPTRGAIIPAAVGVDIGCGMCAVRTSLTSSQLPDDLKPLRTAIEKAVPHGRTDHGGRNDRGAWRVAPARVEDAWRKLAPGYREIVGKHPRIDRGQDLGHLGTLGTGNHFVELCVDEAEHVWLMLHSGSRGVGNRIGTYFIEAAKADLRRRGGELPDVDLAYLKEGSDLFDDYVQAVDWAQRFARENRRLMTEHALEALRGAGLPPFRADLMAVNCHHNYVAKETHGGEEVFVTRKGAVRAAQGDLGIIPGSMGAKSFIVRGKGNPESLNSCSHGAGRALSRTAARKAFTLADHAEATRHVECRKDDAVLDETPGAYKPIDAVMDAQSDLVDVVHVLRQVVCVKG